MYENWDRIWDFIGNVMAYDILRTPVDILI